MHNPNMMPRMEAGSENKPCCCDAVSGQPLAMAYVPMQTFENLYSPEAAICAGTLFADLDKPFCGEAVSNSAYPTAPARTCSGMQCTVKIAQKNAGTPGNSCHTHMEGGCHRG